MSRVSSVRTKKSAASARGSSKEETSAPKDWMLRLYVAGQSSRSLMAIENLRRICDEHMPSCTVEIIDLARNPELAKTDQIVAIPTLVRRLPAPVRRMIGDLSATEKILVTLDLEPN